MTVLTATLLLIYIIWSIISIITIIKHRNKIFEGYYEIENNYLSDYIYYTPITNIWIIINIILFIIIIAWLLTIIPWNYKLF